jgi:hypothetical protein
MPNEVDGKLFTSNPEVKPIQWINDIEFTQPVKRNMDIEFNNKVINSKVTLAERNSELGNVRDIKLSLNDFQLKTYAMAKLAKFLRQYRYQAKAEAKNGKVKIAVNFENNPMDYTFEYEETDGNIVNKPLFKTCIADMVNEYPFSIAGVQDSIEDVKNIDLKKSTKVKKATFKYTVMTRYEILKRCNNRLELAKKLINKNIEEGNIVAVGSNEYASTYDLNYLFPDTKEKFAGEENHSLEFVANKVAKGSYENKSANRLALEASNILNKTFSVTQIVRASRDMDKLFVTAEIMHNNIRDTFNFDFSINKEKVSKLNYIEDNNCERYTVAQLMNQFGEEDKKVVAYLNGSDKQIAGGYVYSTKTIRNKLSHLISPKNIGLMLEGLENQKLASKLNSTTYASKFSLNELIKKLNVEFLSDEAIKQIKLAQAKFGQDDKFYSYETKDNDTRNKLAVKNVELKKNKVVEAVEKHFKNFDVKMLSSDKFVLSFKTNNGKQRNVSACIHDGAILCNVGGKDVSLQALSNMFSKSKLLMAYLNDNDIENDDLSKENKIIISKAMFNEKLRDYISKSQIDELISKLECDKKITKLNSTTYASKLSFDDLIRNCDYEVDSDIKTANLEKGNKVSYRALLRQYISDNDTRVEAFAQKKNLYKKVKSMLDSYITSYELKMLDNVNMTVSLKSNNSSKRNLMAKIKNDNIVFDVYGKEIPLNRLAKSFAQSDLLKSYVKENGEDRHGKVIISTSDFHNKLKDLIDCEKINELISKLEHEGKITKVSSTKYASEMNFEELIRHCDIKVNENLKKENMLKKSKVEDKKLEAEYVDDCDTRQTEKKITASEFKVQFLSGLPKNIKCISFNNVNIKDNYVTAEVTLYHKDYGVKNVIKQDFGYVREGRLNPELLINHFGKDIIDGLFNVSTATKTFNKFNDNKEYGKVIISKRNLINKLKNIINVDNIDEVISNFVDKKQLVQLSSDKYASEVGIEELINNSNMKAYDAETIDKNFRKSKINTEVVPKDYHVEDCDSKNIANIEDGKTNEQLKDIKASYIDELNVMEKDFKVTAKKKEMIIKKIEEATDYLSLDEIHKEITRYY